MKDYDVYLSPLAELKLDLLLQYLETKGGIKVKTGLLEELINIKNQISKFPKSYPESEIKKGIRKGVVTKHTSKYYRIHNGSVEIITVIDNRQNPNKIAKEIEKYFEK